MLETGQWLGGRPRLIYELRTDPTVSHPVAPNLLDRMGHARPPPTLVRATLSVGSVRKAGDEPGSHPTVPRHRHKSLLLACATTVRTRYRNALPIEWSVPFDTVFQLQHPHHLGSI